MLVHCHKKFRPDEIQYLIDNSMFTHRRIETGTCPECEKLIVRLYERRIIDNKVFDSTYTEQRAKRVLKENANDIEYTSLDYPKQNSALYGFRYGQNNERKNKSTGETTITQKAVDFYGNKEVVKSFKFNTEN